MKNDEKSDARQDSDWRSVDIDDFEKADFLLKETCKSYFNKDDSILINRCRSYSPLSMQCMHYFLNSFLNLNSNKVYQTFLPNFELV